MAMIPSDIDNKRLILICIISVKRCLRYVNIDHKLRHVRIYINEDYLTPTYYDVKQWVDLFFGLDHNDGCCVIRC